VNHRLGSLAAGLDDLGCKALLVVAQSADEPDLAAFLGRPVHVGQALLVAAQGEPPRLVYFTPMEREEAAATGLALISPDDVDLIKLANDFPEPAPLLAQVAGRALERCGVAPGRVALAGSGPAGVVQGLCSVLAAAGWVWVPGNGLVQELRKAKTQAELQGLGAAGGAVARAVRHVASLLAAAEVRDRELWLGNAPLTVARVRSEVARLFADLGLSQPRGNIIAPGREGAVPHNAGTPERVLLAGESLVVDLYPKGVVFADCTRTFCVGTPPEALVRAHASVCEALEEAHLRSSPGVRGWDVQQAVCARLAAAGYPTMISEPTSTKGYVHNLGHGVGYALHEYPSFKKSAGGEGVLRTGDVFTLEPGLYDPEAGWGVRLEDLVALGPDGLETLTPLPYDLDPRAYALG
jgi:Xaa-Pro aminopeptidase